MKGAELLQRAVVTNGNRNVLRRSDVEGYQAKENRCRFLLGDGESDQQPKQHRTDTSLQGGGGGPRNRVGFKGSLLHENCRGECLEPAVKLGSLLGRRRAPIQPASIFSKRKRKWAGVWEVGRRGGVKISQ